MYNMRSPHYGQRFIGFGAPFLGGLLGGLVGGALLYPRPFIPYGGYPPPPPPPFYGGYGYGFGGPFY